MKTVEINVTPEMSASIYDLLFVYRVTPRIEPGTLFERELEAERCLAQETFRRLLQILTVERQTVSLEIAGAMARLLSKAKAAEEHETPRLKAARLQFEQGRIE